MKKSGLIVASLMLAGTVAMAADPVYSVNTVGYQKISVPSNGWNMLSLNWNKIGNVDQVPINEAIGSTGLMAGPDFGSADRLYVWDVTLNSGNGGYKIYYLWDGDSKWYEAGNDANPTTDVLDRGQGLWLRHIAGATNIVMVGEVPVNATNIVSFGAGKWAMFGSAYTADLALNGVNQTWSGNAGPDFGSADRMYVWNNVLNGGSGGYKIYYLWDGDGKWYEAGNDANPTTDVISFGSGAWYKNVGPGATTWTETRPYPM